MTKSEFIEYLATHMSSRFAIGDVQKGVGILLESMSGALSLGQRVEIRGFGSFCLHYRSGRVGRNPKTGENVQVAGKYVPYFRAGKELKERVNEQPPIIM